MSELGHAEYLLNVFKFNIKYFTGQIILLNLNIIKSEIDAMEVEQQIFFVRPSDVRGIGNFEISDLFSGPLHWFGRSRRPGNDEIEDR